MREILFKAVSQLWVIRELLGTRIEELGGESIEIRIE